MFFRKKNYKNVLVVDIGSASINCFMLSVKIEGKPEISATLRARMPLLENPDLAHIERYAKKTLKEISADMVKKNAGARPEAVFVVMSAPWYFCETRLVKVSRPEPFTVDRDLLDKLISDELEIFSSKAREQFAGREGEIAVLDKEIMRSIVNGYTIKDPVGKTTKELEAAIYLSAGKKNFLDQVRDILGHFFGSVPVRTISEPLAIFKILSGMANSEEGFLVVDVGGEVTEVYLVRDGILEVVKNFTWGGNLMVRRLASLLKVDLNEALSFFKTNSSKDLKENLEKKISPSLEGVCSEWQNFLSQSLSDMGKNAPLPQTLILLGGMAGNEVLKSCANAEEFSSFTVLGKPFNVLTFIPENLEGRISLAGIDRKDPQMTLPLLLALDVSQYAGAK